MAHSSMADRARKQAEERKNKGKGGTTIQLPDNVDKLEVEKGTMHLDIVPYEVSVSNHREGVKKGDLWYERTYGVHPSIGVDERWYICPKLTIGKPCPICEEHAKMRKDPDADEDVVKALRPKERQLFNVIDLDSKKQEVQVLDISWWLFGKMVEEEVREGSKDAAGFADLEGGKTLVVRFSSASLGGNAYLEASRVDFEKREDYGDKILNETVDLDAVLVIPSYEELEKALKGTEEEPEEPKEERGGRRSRTEEEPPAEEPRGRRREPEPEPEEPRRRRSEPEPEPEEPPARRSRREEPEEPPRRKREEEPEPEPEEPPRRRLDSKDGGKKDEWDNWGLKDDGTGKAGGKEAEPEEPPRGRRREPEPEPEEPRRRRRE